MRQFSHDELLELLPAYAVGALTAEETAAVDAALRADSAHGETLRRELRAFQEVVTQMASANPVIPRAALKQRLLARIANARPPASAAQIVSLRRTRRWLVGTLAASLLLAAALGVYSASLRRSLASRDATLDAIFLAERGLRVAYLKGTDTLAGPGIQFFWNERQRKGVLQAFRLKPAPQGRSYQLWLIRDGKPVSAAVFNSDPDGHARVERFTLPESARGTTLVALTEEPAGGSPAPTTTPFLAGPLSDLK